MQRPESSLLQMYHGEERNNRLQYCSPGRLTRCYSASAGVRHRGFWAKRTHVLRKWENAEKLGVLLHFCHSELLPANIAHRADESKSWCSGSWKQVSQPETNNQNDPLIILFISYYVKNFCTIALILLVLRCYWWFLNYYCY